MPIRNSLDKILNHEVKTKLLRILCRHNTGWTGRQLAEELSVSPTTASKLLAELVCEGVVNKKGVGRSYLYSLNEGSYVVKCLLRPFFQKERDVFNALISLIKRAISKSSASVETAAIFGSVARGKETAASDVDLLLVTGKAKDKEKIEITIDEITPAIARNFQTAISPYILSKSQFKREYAKRTPIIKNIIKSHIVVLGKPIERLVT